ncbi:type II toxin-antitoxin system RelE/ParE family toxin [Lacihabitans sp. CS3-21]|uniref:type II toxin-antitoxin system RelE/ParE family toxin n=1 Tax=Lacihabitans sp. CS3-21 TaxID=2487332 RepID=UPI0020CD33E0|nr:type II toxin-antitoxin system RelE/ParE family toxin [Lacihabitans sp. CS3-21]
MKSVNYIFTASIKFMIKSIQHKGLKHYWTKGDKSKLPSKMMAKIERVLNLIDYLEKVPGDLENLTFLKPHPLKGNLKGFWAMQITGNWRIIFKFDNNTREATEVDLVDYH